ncbi:MAG: hypothetical protein RIT24_3100 [Planctomycetota bacterium]|jgi:preprotein translocase subunit YajC
MSTAFVLVSLPVSELTVPQAPSSTPPGPAAGPATTTGTTQAPAGDPAAPGQPQGLEQMCGSQQFLMIGLFVGLMWLMIVRPESKRRKEMNAMLSALKQGDTVVTIGGMHGKVASIAEKTIVLRVDSQLMTFDRSAVARVVRDEAEKKA